jgi:hypothetical protein
MADDQQRPLQKQAAAGRDAAPTPPLPPPISPEIESEPDVPVSLPATAEFEAQLQRLADTIAPDRQERWVAAEILSWNAALISLAVWANWPLGLALILTSILVGRYRRLERRYTHSQHALDLARYDTAWLGPLTLMLESPRPAMRPVAAQLLIRVLPMVTAADFAQLASHQRACLHRRLLPTEDIDIDLALAILTALEAVGDRESLRYVERLAFGMGAGGERKRLRTYAEVCATHLRERLRQETQGNAPAIAASPVEMPAPANAAEQAAISPQERQAVTQVEVQLKLLKEEKRRHQQPGMRLGFLIASWCVIVPYCALETWKKATEGNWPTAFAMGFVTLLATQLHRFCLSSRQSEAARKLAQQNDVRGVGPLAEALEWPDPELQAVAMKALTRLLQQLKATDAHLLNAQQRGNLYRHLNSYQARFHPDFQIAILKALEQVGDEAAIPHVRRLARSVALGPRQQQVRRAAQDCLPFLRNRADQLRVSQTLLRASSATSAAPDILLRPADNRHAAAPEQLLRATEKTE